MNRIASLLAPALAVSAAFALSACDPKPETIDTNPDPMANQIANAAPIELPPSVKESVSYRCKDNSVVFVDFMSDDKTANVRTERTGAPVKVSSETAGAAMSGEGTSVSGSGKSVQIAVKGGAAQTCNR